MPPGDRPQRGIPRERTDLNVYTPPRRGFYNRTLQRPLLGGKRPPSTTPPLFLLNLRLHPRIETRFSLISEERNERVLR